MKKILDYNNFYFIGIKGVAMTSLAQCLLDAGKKVSGCDVAEEFVTQKILHDRQIHIEPRMDGNLPEGIDCVIFTSAHQAAAHPLVQQARSKGLPTITQAEALADLFNQKKGVAVCGVGGKSTTSAMIAWILQKTQQHPSFSVGVGNIPGLEKTGQWSQESQFFVAEADEYVINPGSLARGEESIPRFSFLYPEVTVCTNLLFDHPDVYRDFAHTSAVFSSFFSHLPVTGTLVIQAQDLKKIDRSQLKSKILTCGDSAENDAYLFTYASEFGKTIGTFSYQRKEYQVQLQIPGKFNILNAVSAIMACVILGTSIDQSVEALKSFRSTARRAEFIGEKNGVLFYDDYAHHPNEVERVIQAFREWFPKRRLVVLFQSHTFSRTKMLFKEFVHAFAHADAVLMMDIFPSAREAYDSTITSDMLCDAIQQQYPHITAQNFGNLSGLAGELKRSLIENDIVLSLGAGDIYQIHDLLK